jgi:hypothetical protein
MVFDGVRNAAYVEALAQLVGSHSTVIDLGAGLGVHGLSAAAFGAAAVHLVDPAAVLQVASEVAAANGFANIHCHHCPIEELQLDSRVDVIVSVFTGNLLFTEDLLPSLFYARDKFLAPGGHMVPDRARLEVVPVSAPDYYRKHIDSWAAYPEHAARLGLPGLDYRAVRPFAANSLYYDLHDKFQAHPLAAPIALVELDFTVASSADCDGETEVELARDGLCHGWLGWFQIRLGDEWLSTSGESQATHWSPVFLPLDEPLEVKAGEQLGFALKRPEFGDWTWTTRYKAKSQRQSTFRSQPVSRDRLRKASEYYQPRLNRQGEAARWLMAQMAGDLPVAQLAAQLRERFPGTFNSASQALDFVQKLAREYS